MKAVACLLVLSFAGFVSTQYAFKAGNRYVYKGRGRLMTGFSDINTQYSGLELTYKVALQVVSPTTIILQPEDFKVVELNAELEGGWRDGELQNETPVEIKSELLKYLESPIELTMHKGVVESIKVEAQLPTWAVNIKKAQASHFVLDTTGTGGKLVLSGNLNRKTNSVRPEEQNTDSGFFYEVMENTVHGTCETYYTVSQQGPFQPPYNIQPQAQAGDEDSQENSVELNRRESSEETMKEYKPYDSQQYANYEEYLQQEKKFEEAYQKKYYYAPGQEQKDEAYQYYQPEAYQQYMAYKQYAQGPDSGSAEDSRETRQGELPWPKTFDSFCNSDDQVYEIVKAINFTACLVKPVLSHTNSNGFYGRGGDNTLGTAFDRVVITRYLACGKDRKQFTILNIKQEEQVNFGFRLDQKSVAGTTQNFTLHAITKAEIPVKVQNPKIIKDLSYTFDPQEQRLQKEGQIYHAYNDDWSEDNDSSEETNTNPYYHAQYKANFSYSSDYKYYQGQPYKYRAEPPGVPDSSSEESDEETKRQDADAWFRYNTEAEWKTELPKPSLKYAPINPYLASPLKYSGMKKRIQDLMKEITEDILTYKQSFAETETISKISTVAKILRYLNYDDISELYYKLAAKSQTEFDQTSRNVYLDAVSIAGTNPNIYFISDLIQKKELTGEYAAQIMSTFPMYLRTPTQQILKVIFELMDSSAVAENVQLKTTAILAVSNLFYQACINSQISNSRYPVAIYGSFSNEKLIRREYVPWFINNLKKHMESNEQEDKHWTTTYLTALGNLGVPEVVPIVQTILDDENEPYIKVQAVFALKRLIVSRDTHNTAATQFLGVDRDASDLLTDDFIEQEVLPILVSVQNDKSEHPEVRMAAIALLIFNTNADLTIWQTIAFSTWQPASLEVHSFIYSTLKTLAELENPVAPLYQKLSLKARAVLSLAKPFTQGYAKSQNIFTSNWVDQIQTGFAQNFEFIGSKDSIFPNYLFYRNNLQYGNGVHSLTPVEIDIQGQTIQRLASYMLAQFEKKTSTAEPHQELDEIHNILGISKREQEEKSEGSFRIKFEQEIERLWSVNEETIQQFISKAKGEFVPKLLNGVPINYQKTIEWYEQSMEMPSAMGIPLQFYFSLPIHISARGSIKVVNQNGMRDVQLQTELHSVYSWKNHEKLVFKVPFTGKAYQSGVLRNFVFEAPFRALVRWAPRGELVFAITPSPLQSGTPAGKIDVFTYYQKPYTATISDELWPTTHKEGGKIEIVHVVDTPYKNVQVFENVEKALGLSVQVEEETEYDYQNETPSGWMRFFKQFHTPGCWFNVGWVGTEKSRYAKRKWTLDTSKSETKTLGFALGYSSISNPTVGNLWEDSSSSSSESSETRQFSESKKETSTTANREWKQPTRGDRRRQGESVSHENNLEAGNTVAVALIGKRVPIKTVQENRGQIQTIFSKEYPTTVQYLFQASKSTGRFYVRAAFGDSANEAAESLPQSHSSLQAIREIVVEAQNQKSQPDYCVKFEGKYVAPKHANRHELIVLRKRLLSEDLIVNVKGELEFGVSCLNMPHEIKVQGKLERGPKMTEWAKVSPAAKKCDEDEKNGFSVSPVCLWVAEQQAAALNQATLKIQFPDNLPIPFLNRTDDAEDLFKAFLFPYLSSDNFHEGAGRGQLQVDAYMTPNKEFIDVTVTKPNSRISFRSMKTNDLVKAFLPLTATQSLGNNLRDRVLRDDSEVSCSIEGNTVSTFDNVTYRFHPKVASDCYQVLAKDCSGREPVAVLVKDVTASKMEIVLLLGGQTKIELNQHRQKTNLYGYGKMEVEVNEEKVQSLPRRIFAKDNGEEIASIEEMQDGGVQVISKQFQVGTNGKYIYIQTVNSLRNRTCGLCGDFNGERIGEFRGPKDCALSSGSLLVASYSYQNPKEKSVCKINEYNKRQLEHEQQLCLKSTFYQPRKFAMYAYASSKYPSYYNQQSTPADQCVQKFEPVIRKAVYNVVNVALKPFEWFTESRERMAHSLADKMVLKVKEIFGDVKNVNDLIEKLNQFLCEEVKKLKIHSLAIDSVCKTTKGLFYQALRVVLNPIAEATHCLESANKDYNSVEAAQQIQYAFQDESEHDDSVIPWIPASKLPMSCAKKLELTLSRSISKYAYFVLLTDFGMAEIERLKITVAVDTAVLGAVKTFLRSNNTNHNEEALINEVTRMVDEVFVKGIRQVVMKVFIRRFTKFTLVKLCKIDKCCFFPMPHQSEQQYPSYQQYPQYQQYQQYQQYPQYKKYSEYQQYQQYQQYPQYKKYTEYQQYPQYKKYPEYQQYQRYPQYQPYYP